MIISNFKAPTSTIENSFRNYSLGLFEKDLLIEAIKKDDVNAAENSTLHIANESDIERAERLLKIAKSRRQNKEALAVLQKNMELAASEITAYIKYHRKKKLTYILKLHGSKNRRCQFQVAVNGKLKVCII